MLFSSYTWAEWQVDILTSRLDTPWGMTQLPDGRFLVTEKKAGNLLIVNHQGEHSSVEGVPAVNAIGQGGLLDVTLHPNFKENAWAYLSYSAGDSKGYSTEVARGQLTFNSQDKARLENVEKIFVSLPKVRGGHHFGSRLVFDKQQYLFISLGDRGQRELAQDLSTHHGSIIRLHDDGRIPTDNPFVKTAGAKAEIYSYGHRNVQGMALHPQTGIIWAQEHGPQGGDELNEIRAGKNYGWPTITYGAEYGTGFKIGEGTQKKGMEQPIYYWDPSIAPSGMAFFQGDVWIGALKYQLLTQLTMKKTLVVREQRHFAKQFGRIRDVESFDDTNLYLLTDSRQGQLIRLTPKK